MLCLRNSWIIKFHRSSFALGFNFKMIPKENQILDGMQKIPF